MRRVLSGVVHGTWPTTTVTLPRLSHLSTNPRPFGSETPYCSHSPARSRGQVDSISRPRTLDRRTDVIQRRASGHIAIVRPPRPRAAHYNPAIAERLANAWHLPRAVFGIVDGLVAQASASPAYDEIEGRVQPRAGSQSIRVSRIIVVWPHHSLGLTRLKWRGCLLWPIANRTSWGSTVPVFAIPRYSVADH